MLLEDWMHFVEELSAGGKCAGAMTAAEDAGVPFREVGCYVGFVVE